MRKRFAIPLYYVLPLNSDDGDQEQPTSIQFSIRTLLLLMFNVALLAWVARLSGRIDDLVGLLLIAYGVLFTIYLWRYWSIRSQHSTRSMKVIFVIVLIGCFPYVYLGTGYIEAPIWIFAIPAFSFLTFDLSGIGCSRDLFLIRSLLEVTIFFWIWSIVWLFLRALVSLLIS